jgi:hypothetical protein
MLEQALAPVGLPVKYYEYAGAKDSYIVYNEEYEQPVDFGDNQSNSTVMWWQVHIFVPKNTDFRKHKKKAVEALKENGFVITDIRTLCENAQQTNTIHVVIYCHMEEREEE